MYNKIERIKSLTEGIGKAYEEKWLRRSLAKYDKNLGHLKS